jgi:hypothetical protein
MKKCISAIIVVIINLTLSLQVSANALPYNIGHIEDFLSNPLYFNGWEEVDQIDFSGIWDYTAIGFESGNINITQESVTNITTFSTANPANFGTYQTINFDTDNLYFEDSDGPFNVALDPYQDNNYFELYRLTKDSNALDYLNNLTLGAGTIIVGFNDNGWDPRIGDSDYDDIIIAMNSSAAPVPEPASMMLFGTGLIGLAAFTRRKLNFKK